MLPPYLHSWHHLYKCPHNLHIQQWEGKHFIRVLHTATCTILKRRSISKMVELLCTLQILTGGHCLPMQISDTEFWKCRKYQNYFYLLQGISELKKFDLRHAVSAWKCLCTTGMDNKSEFCKNMNLEAKGVSHLTFNIGLRIISSTPFLKFLTLPILYYYMNYCYYFYSSYI